MRAAVSTGTLSLTQIDGIADAATADPSAESELRRARRAQRCAGGAGEPGGGVAVRTGRRVGRVLAAVAWMRSAHERDVTTVVRVDDAALLRGATEPRESCEIVGGGPIPVSVAQRMLDDCFLKVLLVDGTDVRAVSHPGRTIPARLRTAVEERRPECDLECCHVRHDLEIDHNVPVEEQGPTALWNLGRLCRHHHQHKHRYGLRLVGEAGRMRFAPASEWVPP